MAKTKILLTAAVVGVALLTSGLLLTRQAATSPASGSATPESPEGTPDIPLGEPSPAASSQPEQPKQDTSAKNSTIITTSDPGVALAYAAQRSLRTSPPQPLSPGLYAIMIEQGASDRQIAELNALPGVVTAPNYIYQPAFVPTDTNYAQQWNSPKTQLPEAWDITTGSSDTTIAVIDSGILSSQTINGTAYTQSDLPSTRMFRNLAEQGTTTSNGACWDGSAKNKTSNNCDDDGNGYIDDWQGWDFMGGFRGNSANCPNFTSPTEYNSGITDGYVGQDNDPQPYSCDSPSSPNVLNKDHYDGTCRTFISACVIGHGTMVASVAAAEPNNGQIAGVDHHAKLMNLRIFDGYGFTDTLRISSAVYYATANGADIVNLSLAYTECTPGFTDTTLETALAYAKSQGVTIVAASGNTNTTSVCYPASSENVIAVGASDNTDARASFSSYGDKLDLIAPGQSVPVANAPSLYQSASVAYGSGTSFSSPMVAGLAGLIKAVRPATTPDEMLEFIRGRGDLTLNMKHLSFTNEYGYGRMNAYTSVRVAQGVLPVYKVWNVIRADFAYTDSLQERNDFLSGLKNEYVGIETWNTGPSSYNGNISDYRKTQRQN